MNLSRFAFAIRLCLKILFFQHIEFIFIFQLFLNSKVLLFASARFGVKFSVYVLGSIVFSVFV